MANLTNREMFELTFKRPVDYFDLPIEDQLEINEELGISDWESGELTNEDLDRFLKHYNIHFKDNQS